MSAEWTPQVNVHIQATPEGSVVLEIRKTKDSREVARLVLTPDEADQVGGAIRAAADRVRNGLVWR